MTLEAEVDPVATAAEWLRGQCYHVSADLRTDSAGAAALLGVTEKTFRNRRNLRTAPPHAHRIGRKLYYRIVDVLPFRDPR